MKQWQVFYDFHGHFCLSDGTIETKSSKNGCFFLCLSRDPLTKPSIRLYNQLNKFVKKLEEAISDNRKQKIEFKDWTFKWTSSKEV